MILAGSAGVIGSMGIAVILSSFKIIFKFIVKNWIIAILICVGSLFVLSGLFERFQYILNGEDYSGMVRVVFSLQAAIDMLDEKGLWWFGVGPGQIKFQIERYTSDYAAFGGTLLPNSIANTIASVGIIGTAIKFTAMFWLYFKTKSYKNYYSNSLFIFIFIYQFTGGYFNNINEYVVLGIAFGYARYSQRIGNSNSSQLIGPRTA
jgi:hypothetical protein